MDTHRWASSIKPTRRIQHWNFQGHHHYPQHFHQNPRGHHRRVMDQSMCSSSLSLCPYSTCLECPVLKSIQNHVAMPWERKEHVCLSGNVSKRKENIWEPVLMDSSSEAAAVTTIHQMISMRPSTQSMPTNQYRLHLPT